MENAFKKRVNGGEKKRTVCKLGEMMKKKKRRKEMNELEKKKRSNKRMKMKCSGVF
jgi:hypothetical protein